MDPEPVVLERKIIGVHIRAARERRHRAPKEVAQRIGVSQARLRQYEMGTREISLPELENLACFLDVPVDFFLSNETLAQREPARPLAQEQVRARRALLATRLKQARLDAHKTEEECARAIGRTVAQHKRYEAGRTDIPITELERLAQFLNVGLSYFLQDGPARKAVGETPDAAGEAPDVVGEAPDPELWSRLPLEVRALIMDPNSLPYLRIAARFRDLPPRKLQELGEILLVVR